MRISRIYHPTLLKIEDLVVLTPEKSHYLIQVMRSSLQEEVILFHQPGIEFLGKIEAIEGKKKPLVSIKIYDENIKKTESPLKISLVQSLAKGDKMDWIVQKAVELGVFEIYPVITEYSDVKLHADRMLNRQQHWQNIALSATEQSERTHLPLVHFPEKLSTCLSQLQNDPVFCLHPYPPALPLDQSLQTLKTPHHLTILIGPEGGFSPKEISLFERAHFNFITLGPRILRTETAAIVVQSLLQNKFGDIL